MPLSLVGAFAPAERPSLPVIDSDRGVLASAARRAVERFRDDSGDALKLDDVRAVAADLVHRIWAQHDRVARSDDGAQATESSLGLRLLELIRAAVLECTPDDAPKADLVTSVATLRAIEAVREQIEPDWSGHFGSRLSGPSGLDLVVEVAHDLRSPLTSILFLAETMLRGLSGSVSPMGRRQLSLVYGAALGLSSVTSDVVELVRGGDQLLEKTPAPFSVAEVFESLCAIIQPIAEEKGLEVRTVLPVGDHRVGHRVALSRMLLNLTTNALRHTDEGFVEIAATESGPRNLEFSVRDTGRGFATESLSTLCQPFQRTASSQGHAFSGTGLGLTICNKLARAMRSELQFETRPNWGTRFYFDVDVPEAGLS